MDICYIFADIRYFNANNYIRSLLTFGGVLPHFPSHTVDLEAAYHFLDLIQEFNVEYGIPRALQFSLPFLGLIFLLVGLFEYYKHQFPTGSLGSFSERFFVTFSLLTTGVIVVEFSQALTFIVYFVLVFYLGLKFYELQEHDTPDGLMFLAAFVNSLANLSVVIALGTTNPQVFSELTLYYSFFTLNIISTAASTFGTIYLSGHKKILLYVNAAFLAWSFNYVGLFSFLYGKGISSMAFRIIAVSGHYPVVLWALPYLSLWISLITAALTIYIYTKKDEKKKSTSTAVVAKQ